MSVMKKFMKEFQSLDRWVHYLLGVCVILLLISLFWPRHPSIGVRLVPVPGSSYYKAVFEGFSEDDKIKNALSNSKPAFVAFVTDWCGYCKKLKPIWKEFEESYKGEEYNIISVDCTKYKDLAKKHNISGYPTIMYLPKGLGDTTGSIDYKGERTPEAFYSFLSQYH